MNNSHLRIATASISCFMNDGTLDLKELSYLLSIALEDGEVNEEEARVLSNVFKRVKQHECGDEVWAKIQEVKEKYNIK
ncbi:hypothetical protein ACXHQ0_20890 [Vibrio antiquarius]|uniref:Uncharacterized protein n=1 Tax=Vibrio parahaemolyticus TaxID=670 RepID=A0AA46Z9U3_VIBPH|nr:MULTISPECIES: hypothetical protein [Vibrio harveyi group]EGQ8962165.1 hypothetical protein [Vibrio parahaemolyticus]EGR5928134.1 hypothetical protein [Vibrio parahaemolyticus]KOE83609.1 hypothetical protein ACS91_20675 [Vibrio parahaemolyticus]KOY37069.1 hypothetical protein ACX10_16005 [Vibrio parahaemolyticus]MCS0114879.1 hypothetical protein [Vibrio parahaemolyticus]